MERIKELPGAPWDENYIYHLLTGNRLGGKYEPFDVVYANGYRYTLHDKRVTSYAELVLKGVRNA